MENITNIKNSLIVNNITLNLRSNGRVFGQGNGYVTSTIRSDVLKLNNESETEIEMCVKSISEQED